jgi:hypothetical protein
VSDFKVLTFDGSPPPGPDVVPGAKLAAFLSALPRAGDEEFVNALGVGTYRAKHVRRGLERGVLVVHWSGVGLCIRQPSTHGACEHCKGQKGSQPCEHCACLMCSWMRIADERASPRVSEQKLLRLAARLKAFQPGAQAEKPAVPALDDDL